MRTQGNEDRAMCSVMNQKKCIQAFADALDGGVSTGAGGFHWVQSQIHLPFQLDTCGSTCGFRNAVSRREKNHQLGGKQATTSPQNCKNIKSCEKLETSQKNGPKKQKKNAPKKNQKHVRSTFCPSDACSAPKTKHKINPTFAQQLRTNLALRGQR